MASTLDANNNNKVKGISQLKTGADLKNKLEALKRGRHLLDAQWKINLAFYKGKQYTFFNKTSRRIEQLPVDDGEKPRYRVRIVNNQIVTGAHALLAKLTKTKPVMHAAPVSGSDQDNKAAQLADKLLEYWWDELCLSDRLSEALLWAIVSGQGYWKITWDADAGKAMRFLLDPDGNPITDSSLEDLYRAELRNEGIEPQEQVMYMGDIKVETISPFDVYLDDSAKVFSDAKYAICVHYMTPEEIKSKFKIDVQPDAVSSSPDLLPGTGWNRDNEETLKAVNIGYFLPQPSLPNGRYVIWIDEKIVHDESWPYPFQRLPLIKFPGVRVPGSVYDNSVVEQAIPIQKDLNKTLSQLIEYKNLTLKPRVWAPTGSLNGVRLTSEPGAVYEYNIVAEGAKPEVEQLPTVPPYVFEHLANLRRDIKEVFGITEITEGTPPPNVEAGVAIDLLQEMATDRLAPTIILMEKCIEEAGELMLNYAQEYYKEPRLLKIGGAGSATKARRFSQADLQGGVNIDVETGSALPRSRAARQARIMQFVEMGILRPDMAYKYLDVADMEGLATKMRADEDMAYREHDRLLAGQPINTIAMMQAQMQIQNGEPLGPMGEPITDPEAAQQFIMDESLRPWPFENLQVHLDTHSIFMVSPEFEVLPDEVKQAFITHYSMTLEALNAMPKPIEFKPVTPTLQIKSTIGPTGASKILERAGIETTPEEMSEPPLETWVTDSMDKIDQDEAGNDPLTPLDMHLKELDIEAKIADARARTGTDAASEMQNAIKTAEQGEMARQKIRAAEANAALAEKKLKQSDFKPKPRKPSNGG